MRRVVVAVLGTAPTSRAVSTAAIMRNAAKKVIQNYNGMVKTRDL
jgi:hypothetical protein